LDNSVKVWEAATGRLLADCQGQQGWGVLSVAWAPDGRWLASVGKDGTVKVWEAATGRLLADCQGHQDTVGSVVWAPDGRWLASGAEDRTVKVWEAHTGRFVSMLFFDWIPQAVTFLPGQPLRLVIANSSGQCFGYEVIDS
jgi:WD40 repeat protein